ncbi:hypothetical protein F4604DRAFT_1715902 [Suillus subluteus]|nr:hypothetical protein F4604DRAFT_1715902 [Suillus subluteus]
MKAFSKRSMKLLREVYTLISFSRSSSPVKSTPTYIHRLPVELLQTSLLAHSIAHSTPEVWSRILVTLPGKTKPWKPFLPYFLQCWLARSGRLPLTICIVDDSHTRRRSWVKEVANSRLLDILLSESQRWETGWNPDFNTPRLRTLSCNESNLRRINAPRLSYLHIDGRFRLTVPDRQPALTCKDLRYIHLQGASATAMCSTIASFPHLETIVVDYIIPFPPGNNHSPISNLVLESMTLPFFFFPEDTWQEFIKIFTRPHLPMFQKLTLVGAPEKPRVDCLLAILAIASFQVPVVDCLLAILAIASFQVPVVDFQTGTPLSTVHMNNIASLLSVVREVTYYGHLLQIS